MCFLPKEHGQKMAHHVSYLSLYESGYTPVCGLYLPQLKLFGVSNEDRTHTECSTDIRADHYTIDTIVTGG